MATNINIRYINATTRVDFAVVVFSKNFSIATPDAYYEAWHVLKGHSSVDFVYPVSTSVGAKYEDNGQVITSGPFPAEPGTTWEITQERGQAATLKQSECYIIVFFFFELIVLIGTSIETGVPRNPDDMIVIKNVTPITWSGRSFDVSLYKGGRILLSEKGVRVGSQAHMMLKPMLYFGIVMETVAGETPNTLQTASSLTEFDLNNFPNGLVVTLKEEPGSGQYKFSGASM